MIKPMMIIVLVFAFLGCAAFRQARTDFEACWNDPECRDQAAAKSEDLAGKASALAALSPIPGTAAVARPIAAGAGLLVFLILGGHALRKKKEDPIPA